MTLAPAGRARALESWLLVGGWLLCVATWGLYLLAFWPGFLTEDSIEQWRQAHAFAFGNEHPVAHTLVVWAATRLYDSPASVALFQILVVATVVVAAARELLRLGAPWRLVAVIVAAIAVSPVSAVMAITLWKDIPYAAALLALFVCTLRLWATGGAWAGRRGAVALVATLVLLASLRHNGQFVAVGAVVLMTVIWPQARRPILLAGLAAALLVALVRGPLFSALGVPPIDSYFLLANQHHQLAAILQEGAVLTPEEEAVVKGVMPLEAWRTYACCSVMPTFARGDQGFVASHADEYVWTLVGLARRYPGALLRRQACVSRSVWHVLDHPACLSFTFHPGIVKNGVGLATASKAPALQRQLLRLAGPPDRGLVKTLFWRPALYLYLHLACVIWAAVRFKRRDILALALAAGLNAGVLLVLSTVQDFRFHFGLYLIAMLSIALPFARGLDRPYDERAVA